MAKPLAPCALAATSQVHSAPLRQSRSTPRFLLASLQVLATLLAHSALATTSEAHSALLRQAKLPPPPSSPLFHLIYARWIPNREGPQKTPWAPPRDPKETPRAPRDISELPQNSPRRPAPLLRLKMCSGPQSTQAALPGRQQHHWFHYIHCVRQRLSRSERSAWDVQTPRPLERPVPGPTDIIYVI